MNRTNRSTFYTPIGYVMLMYELESLKQLWSDGLKILIPHDSRPVWPQTACKGTHSSPLIRDKSRVRTSQAGMSYKPKAEKLKYWLRGAKQKNTHTSSFSNHWSSRSPSGDFNEGGLHEYQVE